jgi:hypothetical protein
VVTNALIDTLLPPLCARRARARRQTTPTSTAGAMPSGAALLAAGARSLRSRARRRPRRTHPASLRSECRHGKVRVVRRPRAADCASAAPRLSSTFGLKPPYRTRAHDSRFGRAGGAMQATERRPLAPKPVQKARLRPRPTSTDSAHAWADNTGQYLRNKVNGRDRVPNGDGVVIVARQSDARPAPTTILHSTPART